MYSTPGQDYQATGTLSKLNLPSKIDANTLPWTIFVNQNLRKAINYMQSALNVFLDAGRPLYNGHDGCSSCSSSFCCYSFRKMPKALLIRNGKLRNLAYTFVTSFPSGLPS